MVGCQRLDDLGRLSARCEFHIREPLAEATALPDDDGMNDTQLKKIAEGREAEIFAWEDGAILKLYRETHAGQAAVESASMTAARAAGGPVPAARGITTINGRTGLIMDRVEGIDMLTQLSKKPWTLLGTGGIMGRTHVALHATIAPAELTPLREGMLRGIERSPHVPEHLREVGRRVLATLPDGDRLCHGDFHPGNIILSARGPIVIDWPNSVRGDPVADVARTIVTIEGGQLPPGASTVLKALDKIGRRIILRGYLSAYRRERPFDDALLKRWALPVAIHRLQDGIDGEREFLLARIARLSG